MSYKLNHDIRKFIIEQKTKNPNLSCRGLIPLIRENFQVSLSKSLINKVIKDNNLSSPVGRRGLKKKVPFTQHFEIKTIRKERGLIEHGGLFFLKTADLKLSLTANLAKSIIVYFPNLSKQDLQAMIEAFIFSPLFRNQKSLCLFMGREITPGRIEQFLQKMAKIPVEELSQGLTESGIEYNLNNFNELHKKSLIKLNSFVQLNFFPSAYQFLDFSAMFERFYALWASIKRGESIFEIQLFCLEGFAWEKDIVWQEDLNYAIDRVNASRIFTSEKELLWISSKIEILPAKSI
ncbi:MAG: hypothetical protein PVI33_01415 [Candidatus Omnitrophota bacterium]|jgi:hypothetical protein